MKILFGKDSLIKLLNHRQWSEKLENKHLLKTGDPFKKPTITVNLKDIYFSLYFHTILQIKVC